MKKLLYVLVALSLQGGLLPTACAAKASPPGITFHVLRVIYSESEKNGATLTVRNNSPAPYLMQSQVRQVDPTTGGVDLTSPYSLAMPFIVTPPLSRLEANGELTLRIRRGDVALPADRESVFYVSMKALPTRAAEGQKMAMTVVSNIKMFYRPAGLIKRAVAEMAPKLAFRQEGNTLTARNPTPYWLTFSRLSVGGVALEKPALRMMVPPFGRQRYTLPAIATGKVTWQLIDEDGWNTPVANQD
ncbi:molecular chaperone [Serratia marcescens]|nr:molecular chaperone [Serratia marcescens]